MELPSHLPRDTGDDLCTRTLTVNIGQYVNQGGFVDQLDEDRPDFWVDVRNDHRCNPAFQIVGSNTGGDFTFSAGHLQAVICALFDEIEHITDLASGQDGPV